MAISIGHLVYLCRWETNSTVISIILNGDNYKVGCMIVYESKEHKLFIEALNKKNRNEDL